MIHIFGGGTLSHVRNHLALCAPAYGKTARRLHELFLSEGVLPDQVALHLTRMAGGLRLETNEDVALELDRVLALPDTRAIIFNVALCDYDGRVGDTASSKYAPRLASREGVQSMALVPAKKLLGAIKARRPDVFVVGFKTTAGNTPESQVELALRQVQEAGVDLVLANDTITRQNLLVGAGVTSAPLGREEALSALVWHVRSAL